MSYVMYANNKWSEPKILFVDNWKINGCPVNGPSVSTSGEGVVVGWFSAAENEPKVQVIFSQHGGESFGTPIRLDRGKAIGRVKTTFINSDMAFVSWMEGDHIVGAKVNQNGIFERYVLANSSAQRSSGFHQLAKWNDQVVMAWTDPELKQIKTGFLNFN